jgi:hypothetical protein
MLTSQYPCKQHDYYATVQVTLRPHVQHPSPDSLGGSSQSTLNPQNSVEYKRITMRGSQSTVSNIFSSHHYQDCCRALDEC